MRRKHENTKLLAKILTGFEEEELAKSAEPDSTPTGYFKWQLKIKECCKDKSDLMKLKFTVWALSVGQSAKIVKKKLKALDKFKGKDKERDLAWLLRNLQ